MLKAIHFFAVLIFLTFVSLASSQPKESQPPRPDRSQDTQSDKSETENGSHPTGAAIEIKCDPTCATKNAEENRYHNYVSRLIAKAVNDPLTILTGILAVATVALVLVVLCQLRDAKESSQRQLRAYVAGRCIYMCSFSNTTRASVRYEIENIGLTPANLMTHHSDIFIVPDPLPGKFEFPPVTTPICSSVTVFPHQKFEGSTIASKLFSSDDIKQLVSGNARVYIRTEIFYKDIFEQDHTTHFCVSMVADNDTIRKLANEYGGRDLKISFEAAPVHNTAT